MLDAAIRLAHAESATLVPAYLLLVPLRYPEDSPLRDEVALALPLLEAVEHAALRAGVRSMRGSRRGGAPPTPSGGSGTRSASTGFSRLRRRGRTAVSAGRDVSWILAHAPAETIVLKPSPA